MDRRIIELILGVVLFAVVTFALFVPQLTTVELPAVAYAFVGIGLFAGIVLIGISGPDRPV